jgi:hypothetical protein
MGATEVIYFAVLAAGAVLLYCYAKGGKFFRCALFTAFSGLLALGALWLAGLFLPVPLAVTPLTALTATTLGVPGVIGMLVLLTI